MELDPSSRCLAQQRKWRAIANLGAFGSTEIETGEDPTNPGNIMLLSQERTSVRGRGILRLATIFRSVVPLVGPGTTQRLIPVKHVAGNRNKALSLRSFHSSQHPS